VASNSEITAPPTQSVFAGTPFSFFITTRDYYHNPTNNSNLIIMAVSKSKGIQQNGTLVCISDGIYIGSFILSVATEYSVNVLIRSDNLNNSPFFETITADEATLSRSILNFPSAEATIDSQYNFAVTVNDKFGNSVKNCTLDITIIPIINNFQIPDGNGNFTVTFVPLEKREYTIYVAINNKTSDKFQFKVQVVDKEGQSVPITSSNTLIIIVITALGSFVGIFVAVVAIVSYRRKDKPVLETLLYASIRKDGEEDEGDGEKDEEDKKENEEDKNEESEDDNIKRELKNGMKQSTNIELQEMRVENSDN